jgi:hypothetical protein
MKKLLLMIPPSLTAWFFVGYYTDTGEFEAYTHTFIKKHPTLQIEFENIFANYRDHKPLNELTPEERQQVIAYCKYRLGIDTQLQNQDELEQCKER